MTNAPDEFNGAYIACPDPIDFRAYTTVDLYEDANAYDREGPWRKVARPGHRNYLGHVDTTIRDMNTLELVLGTNGRSGGQWDIWQAVYSPVGANGYPKPIWDKRTGVIDRDVQATRRRDPLEASLGLDDRQEAVGPLLRREIADEVTRLERADPGDVIDGAEADAGFRRFHQAIMALPAD